MDCEQDIPILEHLTKNCTIEDTEVLVWLERMMNEAGDLKVFGLRRFLERYSIKNGCPFDAVVVSGDTDSIYIGVNNDKNKRFKRPCESTDLQVKRPKVERSLLEESIARGFNMCHDPDDGFMYST